MKKGNLFVYGGSALGIIVLCVIGWCVGSTMLSALYQGAVVMVRGLAAQGVPVIGAFAVLVGSVLFSLSERKRKQLDYWNV